MNNNTLLLVVLFVLSLGIGAYLYTNKNGMMDMPNDQPETPPTPSPSSDQPTPTEEQVEQTAKALDEAAANAQQREIMNASGRGGGVPSYRERLNGVTNANFVPSSSVPTNITYQLR